MSRRRRRQHCLRPGIYVPNGHSDEFEHCRLTTCGTCPTIILYWFDICNNVIEFAKMYGMDVLCSLLTSTGRFYQNAERIVNAADNFVSLHGGIIPPNISVEEIGTLFGVGYKTANIVITYAFDRMDGIPADIHVIRWAVHLGWVPHNCTDGYECSKAIEEWLPKNYWHKVNPVFGSLGQMVNTQTIPFRTLLESKQVQPPEVARLCLSIFKKYGH